MSTLPEQDPLNQEPSVFHAEPLPVQAVPPPSEMVEASLPTSLLESAPADHADQQLLFQQWSKPEVFPPARIPHLGHLLLLGVLAIFSLLLTGILTNLALRRHLFGISSINDAISDVHYTLGTMGLMYFFTLVLAYFIFPLLWQKGLFAGLQWRIITAIRLRRRLIIAAVACFFFALLNGIFMPGPQDTPIDKIFRTPGAAWLMFGFGVTFAPFFEEALFRGFLLPALCTAYDWIGERTSGELSRGSDENGHPQWSMPAMLVGSILTSVPFALMHAEQTSWAVGPMLLLVCVSLVLCWARLSTRSLAASVVVHACYNFLLFSIMLVGTGGFRHIERM